MDVLLEGVARRFASAHLIVFSPHLFADCVWPPPGDEAAPAIRRLIHDFLWPTARIRLAHPIMNRVRVNSSAAVLSHRILVCPLDQDNHALGFMAALRTHAQAPFGPPELAVLSAAVPEVRGALQDRLGDSQLLLRSALESELRRRFRCSASACVVYANLDQVHVVNEVTGFVAADRIIRNVGRLWHSTLAESGDIATHLSGDRFAAVLMGQTLNQSRQWAENTRQRIAALESNDTGAPVTASIGIAVLANAESFQHALAAAETACRVAKDRGRNRVELYSSGDNTVMRRHQEVHESRQLQSALDADSFVLYAQPIVSLGAAAEPPHYEILLRVRNADGSLASIGGLMDAAERYQLLERLDRWVVARVLRQLAPGAAALGVRGVTFSVNITGQSLSQPEFADFLRSEMKAHHIPPGLLDFEITETAAIRNLKATRRFIARMADIGARVALDDFGTGLSSLVHLKDLDVYRMKIDGQFVSDVESNMRSRALIRALVQIAGEIGLDTVAEYVATEGIACGVRELGVSFAQGFLYGRPGPFDQVLETLAFPAAGRFAYG